ncbi:MAG: serine/threonine-protein kinase, partial [Myxococcota bacterium]
MVTPSTESRLAEGQVVERYTVVERIGRGGVARVYKVRHNTLGSLHALKVLRKQSDQMNHRLVLEGKVQAALRHPNVVAVTDVIEVEGNPGLVMDYIEGPSLDKWLAANRPDLAQAEAIFRGIVAGVGKAHRLGLVHRDLKPANVLLATDEDGTLVPKVADFGLAKILAGDDDEEGGHAHTQSGTTMGTPAYMAPEQVRDSKSVDQRADIFALGCILYELVTGVSPFYHPDLFAIFSALASGTYTPPQALVPSLPPRVLNAIAGCLTVHREARIHSCGVLQRVLDGEIAEDWANATLTGEEPRHSLVPPGSTGTASSPGASPSSITGGSTGRWWLFGGLGVVGVG